MKSFLISTCLMMLVVELCSSIKILKNEESTSVNGQKMYVKINQLEEKVAKINRNNLYEIFSASSTIFAAGFCDKSFLITTVMATKYSKTIVFLSAVTSLTLMGYISVQMGLTLPNYVSNYWIDIFAVLAFLFIGLKMVIDGLKMSNTEEEDKLALVQKEINKEILKENYDQSVEIHNEKEEVVSSLSNLTLIKETCEVFAQTFTLVFLSELGDKSQISTIYLSANSDPMTIFYSVTLAQFVLTIIAILGGKLIANKISEKTLTISAGILFLTFGLISLYLTYINDYVIINKAWHKIISSYHSNPHLQKIPDREIIKRSFLQV